MTASKLEPVRFIPEACFGAHPASEIISEIWQGGFPIEPEILRPAGFDVLVLCAEELQPDKDELEHLQLACGLAVIRAPMDDREMSGRELEQTVAVAHRAARELSALLTRGARAIVTCAAGRNRSGLVTGLTLVEYRGMSGKNAVELIQARRPNALTNDSFAGFLERLRAPRKRGRYR